MEHEVTVRFHQVDSAGILYFSRAFEFCHEVLEELLQASGFPLNEVLQAREWLMPIVHASSDYKKPMLLGERIRISVLIDHVGESSLSFKYALKGMDGDLRAEINLVHVVLDAATFQSRTVPVEFLEALRSQGVAP
jgi:1,4-dihydroxy-2-naphthoyl-CoA hydrolase